MPFVLVPSKPVRLFGPESIRLKPAPAMAVNPPPESLSYMPRVANRGAAVVVDGVAVGVAVGVGVGATAGSVSTTSWGAVPVASRLLNVREFVALVASPTLTGPGPFTRLAAFKETQLPFA